MAKKDSDDLLDSFKRELDKVEVEAPRRAKPAKTKKASKKPKKTKAKKANPRPNVTLLKMPKPIQKKAQKKPVKKDYPTLDLKTDFDIAMDFATKVYKKFNRTIKSIILFGSSAKHTAGGGSDIDIIIIIDDAAIKWDQELIAWYREELEKITVSNPYKRKLHINTVKLTTWFDDLLRGDPIVINILRDGEPLIDFGGFFEPLKYLLISGRIKSTPEAVYSLLERAPKHVIRSKISELSSIEGLFWAMVDSAHAALIAAKRTPPSPEKIAIELKENFVDAKKLNVKYVLWYRDLFMLHKRISHREITELKGVEIDEWQDRTEEFVEVMAKLVDEIIKG